MQGVFSANMSLYLVSDATDSHCYYEMEIGNHTQLMNGTSFNDLERSDFKVMP